MNNLLLLAFSALAHAFGTPVDLQFAICEPNVSNLASKLGFEDKAKEGRVTYFDYEHAELASRGIFLKVKQRKGSFTSEVKLAHTSQPHLGVQCEIDRYGNQRGLKCSIEHEASHPVWTPQQKAYGDTLGEIEWDKLSAYGPYLEHRWKASWIEDESLTGRPDILHVPGLPPISEFSLKATLGSEDKIYHQVKDWLEDKGVALCRVQKSKIFRILKTP